MLEMASGMAERLGLNSTLYVQFIIFIVFFLIVSNVFFKPYLKLFEERYKKTVSDKDAAEDLVKQAEAKFAEYKKAISDARSEARQEYDRIVGEAKAEETRLLTAAREEAKKISQGALAQAEENRTRLKQELNKEVETLAAKVTDQLLEKA